MSDQPTDAPPKRKTAPRKRKPASKKTAVAVPPATTVDAITGAAADVELAAAAPPPEAPAPAAPAGPSPARATQAPRPQQPRLDESKPAHSKPVHSKPAQSRPERQPQERSRPGQHQAERAAPPAVAASVVAASEPVHTPLIEVPLSVRWRDLDAFNHVNNSKYLSYLEEARLRWMMTIPGMGLEDHVAPVVAASALNYRRPIEWPGEVVIDLFVERMGTTSVTIGHRVRDARDGSVLYCDGNVVLVWIDRDSGRAAPLPDGVRAACGH